MHLHLDPAAKPLPSSTRALSRDRWTVCQPLSMEPRVEPMQCSQADRSNRIERLAFVTAAVITLYCAARAGLGL